jgi:hypothetical protein
MGILNEAKEVLHYRETTIIKLVKELTEIESLMNEHGHDLALYNELHGAATTIRWILGIQDGPPSNYYFHSANKEERLKEGP